MNEINLNDAIKMEKYTELIIRMIIVLTKYIIIL